MNTIWIVLALSLALTLGVPRVRAGHAQPSQGAHAQDVQQETDTGN